MLYSSTEPLQQLHQLPISPEQLPQYILALCPAALSIFPQEHPQHASAAFEAAAAVALAHGLDEGCSRQVLVLLQALLGPSVGEVFQECLQLDGDQPSAAALEGDGAAGVAPAASDLCGEVASEECEHKLGGKGMEEVGGMPPAEALAADGKSGQAPALVRGEATTETPLLSAAATAAAPVQLVRPPSPSSAASPSFARGAVEGTAEAGAADGKAAAGAGVGPAAAAQTWTPGCLQGSTRCNEVSCEEEDEEQLLMGLVEDEPVPDNPLNPQREQLQQPRDKQQQQNCKQQQQCKQQQLKQQQHGKQQQGSPQFNKKKKRQHQQHGGALRQQSVEPQQQQQQKHLPQQQLSIAERDQQASRAFHKRQQDALLACSRLPGGESQSKRQRLEWEEGTQNHPEHPQQQTGQQRKSKGRRAQAGRPSAAGGGVHGGQQGPQQQQQQQTGIGRMQDVALQVHVRSQDPIEEWVGEGTPDAEATTGVLHSRPPSLNSGNARGSPTQGSSVSDDMGVAWERYHVERDGDIQGADGDKGLAGLAQQPAMMQRKVGSFLY